MCRGGASFGGCRLRTRAFLHVLIRRVGHGLIWCVGPGLLYRVDATFGCLIRRALCIGHVPLAGREQRCWLAAALVRCIPCFGFQGWPDPRQCLQSHINAGGALTTQLWLEL